MHHPRSQKAGNALSQYLFSCYTLSYRANMRAIIPPAPESLAWMATELERQEIAPAPPVRSHEDALAVGQLEAPASVGLYRVQSKASVRFGDHTAPKHGARAPAPSPEQGGEDAVEQLSLF
jgi:hypothetical protein